MEFVQNEDLWLDEVSQLMSCGNYNGDIAYDENGNAVVVQDIRFKWSAGRILDGVDYLDTDGSILISDSFTYDEKGIRTSKTVNGKTTYYTTVDGTITSQYELDEQGEVINEMVFLYDSSGNLIGFTYGGNTYFYIKNHMNDVMGIADAGGTWLVSYTYDAYGTVHWQYETNSEVQTDIELNELAELNPMLYRSYYCDRESGIYYLQSRYHLPDFGRFFNADLPEYAKLQKADYAGTNLFAYCNNDPVNHSDPSRYYSASKAKAYAEAWWDKFNSKLYKSNSSGRDCANFVSQCLYAGGLSKMTGAFGSSKGWHNYRMSFYQGKDRYGCPIYSNEFQMSDAWGIANTLYEWLFLSKHISREYVISKYSDVDKVGKILYKKPCAAAIFFADNGKPVRKNINGKIQRVIFKNHAAISGEVFRYKNLYDVYYYAHSNPRNGKRFDKKGKRQYYSIKDYLKKYKGARVYICVLK